MNYHPSPSATNLIERFKEKHHLTIEADLTLKPKYVCVGTIFDKKIGLDNTELETIRDWCKQNNILCEV